MIQGLERHVRQCHEVLGSWHTVICFKHGNFHPTCVWNDKGLIEVQSAYPFGVNLKHQFYQVCGRSCRDKAHLSEGNSAR